MDRENYVWQNARDTRLGVVCLETAFRDELKESDKIRFVSSFEGMTEQKPVIKNAPLKSLKSSKMDCIRQIS